MTTDYSNWIGREARSAGTITADLADRFYAALDFTPATDADMGLPLGIHWCIGLEAVPTCQLGADGHPPKGGFLPPIPLERRMWASGALEVAAPLRVGQSLERVSRIESVTRKQGSTGPLCFVTLSHQIHADGQLAISERQDIVYREAANLTAPPPVLTDTPQDLPADAARLVPSTPMLFRYSALTFNSHRIHYDLVYARDVEGYAGLVVHGPLQATLLAEHARQVLGRRLRQFSFRGQAAAFAGHQLGLTATASEDGLTLGSRQFGATCMSAVAK